MLESRERSRCCSNNAANPIDDGMRYVSSLLLGVTALWTPAAIAEPPKAGHQRQGLVTVDIPTQPLSSALSTFAAQTGEVLVILTPPGMLAGKRAPALSATAPVDDLLRALLADTDVHFERTSANTVVLSAVPTDQTATHESEPSDFEAPRYLAPVVVSGSYYASLTSATLRERAASSLTEAIDATDIGSFPAQNAAEALLRVPGVTVSRDRGEALFVGVRSLPASFQSVALNGVPLAVNENVRDSNQDGRQFRFDILPTEIIAGIDVIKAPTAAMDEGAIGAAINVRTFRPLDLPDATRVFTASASHTDLPGSTEPRLSGIGSWQHASGKAGLISAITYSERSVRQDRITFGTWEEISLPGEAGTVLAPTSFRPTLEREGRKRLGLNTVIQIEPSSGVSFDAEAFYVRLDGRYRELTYSADLDPATVEPDSLLFRSGVVVGLTGRAASQIGYEESQLTHDNLFLTSGIRIEKGNQEISGRIAYAEASSQTRAPITRTRINNADVGRVSIEVPRLFEGLPDIRFLDGNLEDPGLLAFRRIEYRKQESLDIDQSAQIDLRSAVDRGIWTDLRAGMKYRLRERDYRRRDRLFTQNSGAFFPASFYLPFPVSDFLGGEAGDLPRRWLLPDASAFAEASNFTPNFEAPSGADLRNSYSISEQIWAVYLMGEFVSDPGFARISTNAGIRFSHTRQVSEGHALSGQTPIAVSSEADYSDVLPAANLLISFDNGLDLRASAARVITRPSLADLAPRLTLNSSGQIFEAVGGNPALKRYEAWQGDLTATYFSSENSQLHAGVFVKQFDTFVFNQITDIEIDGRLYALTAPANGGDALVYGTELALSHRFADLPAPWSGLGLEANYTRARSKATYAPGLSGSLENVAGESFSISGIFEQGPLQARLVFNALGEIPQAVGTNDPLTSNTEGFRTLDGILGWRVTGKVEVSLEAQNLTDEVQYLSTRGDLFSGYTRYGRTFALSVRYRTDAGQTPR